MGRQRLRQPGHRQAGALHEGVRRQGCCGLLLQAPGGCRFEQGVGLLGGDEVHGSVFYGGSQSQSSGEPLLRQALKPGAKASRSHSTKTATARGTWAE